MRRVCRSEVEEQQIVCLSTRNLDVGANSRLHLQAAVELHLEEEGSQMPIRSDLGEELVHD